MKILPRLILALFLLAASLSIASPASAQEGGTLIIGAPETDSFPTIQFRLELFDSQGNFLNDLQTGEVQVVEDGQPLDLQKLETLQNGLQIIFALNTSPSMATRKDGLSGYQQVQKALADWAASQPADTLDDFSLSTPTGLVLTRDRSPQQFTTALSDYQPDLLKTQPALGSLAEALDLATDPLGRPSMKRAILYITPPLASTDNAALEDLTTRALGTGARVSVWLIAPANMPAGAGSLLEKLAQATGGQYAEIAPNAALPEIEPLLKPLRSAYLAGYTSAIQRTGQHRLSVQVNRTGLSLASGEQSFRLDIQPPNPILLSPPVSIQRTWVSTSQDAQPALSPDSVPLQIMIEFPDKHRRALKATRLYVNGEMVEENTGEPFESFTWSIAGLTSSGRQMLRVEAIDTLNLSGSSIDIPVDVQVEEPQKNSLADHISGRGMIAIGAVAASGATLALVLALSSSRRAQRRRRKADKKLFKDPVTQPVPIRQDHARARKERSAPVRTARGWPVSWPKPGPQSAPARLVSVDESGQPVTGGSIALNRQEITFGSDPQRATQVFDSPTVDGLHARLYREQDGHFYLADQGSIAGTWINFEPVTESAVKLQHGDLIHIGKVMFRFELAESGRGPVAEIKVIDLGQ